ncbi:hypothetical protein [Ramlibacter sp.]|uniref:hypothetical protein n=1 Tax=Ramlibacter sp. TaxID=1917967 RepID=UPI002D5E2633|nr:hypothetical protein [Ramlibacter sp.]HYD75682.1 hypothetical protein [Ramlibacter sp.]
MSVLRTLLAWLLLAALPLQGFAAATTLLCGPAHHAATASAGATAAHHAASDGHGHAHEAQAFESDADADATTSTATDIGHSCNLCAAACHGLGVASQPSRFAPADAPQVLLTEAFQRLASRPAPVPDKPPRA